MSLLAQINNAAHTGAFGHNPRSEPTLAQLAAGNYKKGVVMVKGLSIAIENPAYTYRKGMDKTGQQWMCLMQAHYGYIQGHKGNDGDDMDVFIGVAPENDTVYIVNQKTADGYFDEHKIMLGFLSQQQAVDTYQHCFERGWTGLMSVVPCTMTQFKWWLANGNKSRPVTLDRLPYAGLERLDSVNWGGTDGSNLYSHDGQVHKLLYQIRQCDDTHQALEPLAYHDMIAELGNQGFMYENYDALIVEYNKLEKKAKQLLMVMQGAADTVKPVGVTVSKPLTKGGVANVVAWFEMDDGQAVGVFFHNPDKTPKKINPTDEMISYKWVLNKKDITIAVAPEQGKDLVIRTVAKRIMQLVEKNHERFVKANGDKAALNQTEQDLSAQVTEKQATLKGLQDEVVALQARKAEKEAAQLAQEKVIEPVVQEPEATLSNRFAEHDAIAKQYGYSVNSSGVIFTPKGKNTGVKIGSPAGRLKISNAKELLFSGVNPTGLGKFLESYWYAEKTKAVVVPTVSAEQEPVTLTGKELGDFEPIQERPSKWRTNLANARAVAKSLGIETKGKKLANLVGEIDEAQTTQPVSETVTQPVQTPVVPEPTPAVAQPVEVQPVMPKYINPKDVFLKKANAVYQDMDEMGFNGFAKKVTAIIEDVSNNAEKVDAADKRLEGVVFESKNPLISGEWRDLATGKSYFFENMEYGEVIDTRKEGRRNVIDPWRTTDGEYFESLREAKAHELETYAKQRLIDDGFMQGVKTKDKPQPAIESPTPNPDRDYLQSIIDGEADLSNGDDVEAKLTDISGRLDAELEPMFEQAAEAFAQYAIAQAATV